MFGDKVGGARVQRPSKEGGEQEVEQGRPTGGFDEEKIGREDKDGIKEVVPGRFLRSDETGSERVKQDLKRAVEQGREVMSVPYEIRSTVEPGGGH
jgi:hypothetical protein